GDRPASRRAAGAVGRAVPHSSFAPHALPGGGPPRLEADTGGTVRRVAPGATAGDPGPASRNGRRRDPGLAAGARTQLRQRRLPGRPRLRGGAGPAAGARRCRLGGRLAAREGAPPPARSAAAAPPKQQKGLVSGVDLRSGTVSRKRTNKDREKSPLMCGKLAIALCA